MSKEEVTISDIDRCIDQLDFERWYSVENIQYSSSTEIQRDYNRRILLLESDDDDLITDDCIMVDYINGYLLFNKGSNQVSAMQLLFKIKWLVAQFLSSYALSMLEVSFAELVQEENIQEIISELEATYLNSDPLIKESWRNFIIEASHINDWKPDKLRILLTDHQYRFMCNLQSNGLMEIEGHNT